MIATPTGYHDPQLGIAFVVVIAILVILSVIFPEKKKDD